MFARFLVFYLDQLQGAVWSLLMKSSSKTILCSSFEGISLRSSRRTKGCLHSWARERVKKDTVLVGCHSWLGILYKIFTISYNDSFHVKKNQKNRSVFLGTITLSSGFRNSHINLQSPLKWTSKPDKKIVLNRTRHVCDTIRISTIIIVELFFSNSLTCFS